MLPPHGWSWIGTTTTAAALWMFFLDGHHGCWCPKGNSSIDGAIIWTDCRWMLSGAPDRNASEWGFFYFTFLFRCLAEACCEGHLGVTVLPPPPLLLLESRWQRFVPFFRARLWPGELIIHPFYTPLLGLSYSVLLVSPLVLSITAPPPPPLTLCAIQHSVQVQL